MSGKRTKLTAILLHCAVRELEEELRLSVDPKTLELKGAILSNVSEGTSKHVALVYEWRAQTDEVEVALSNAEFFERTGNSLSGTFLGWDAVLKEHEKGELTEEWSSQIIRNLVAETSGKARRDLFDVAR
jgi:predicted NUDIX family phosphoesterase